MRLSRNDFDYLLKQIGPKIQRMDTNMRLSLSAKDKLIITLRYLATGDSYKTLEYAFRVCRNFVYSPKYTLSLFVI